MGVCWVNLGVQMFVFVRLAQRPSTTPGFLQKGLKEVLHCVVELQEFEIIEAVAHICDYHLRREPTRLMKDTDDKTLAALQRMWSRVGSGFEFQLESKLRKFTLR